MLLLDDLSLGMLAIAWLWDLLLGEFPSPCHPVVWIGRLIRWAVRYAPRRPRAQLWYGVLMAAGIPGLASAMSLVLLSVLTPWPWLKLLIGAMLFKSSFAINALYDAGMALWQPLQRGEIDSARLALRSLCSRDPSALSAPELANAGIASVAENTGDSFIGPLFYFVLFGVPGALFYRAVNTLDAVVGYRNHFEYLGKASARLDDVLSWIPSRLAALSLIVCGWSWRLDWRQAYQVARRDHSKTVSPNGGWPMACMAGLLGISIVKPGCYHLGSSPHLGNPQILALASNLVRFTGSCTFVAVLIILLLMEPAARSWFG